MEESLSTIDAELEDAQNIIVDQCPSCGRRWGSYTEHLYRWTDRFHHNDPCIRIMNSINRANLEHIFMFRDNCLVMYDGEKYWHRKSCQQDYDYFISAVEQLRSTKKRGMVLEWVRS